MRQLSFVFLFLCAFNCGWSGLVAVVAGEPVDAARLAPVLTGSAEKHKRIYLAGEINEEQTGKLGYRLLYEARSALALELTDATDGTPVLLLVDKRLFAYNAVESAVLNCRNAAFEFGLSCEGDEFKQTLGFCWADKPSQLSVNLGSLFNRKFLNEKVVADGSTLRIVRTLENGAPFTSVIDPSRKYPFLSVAITAPGFREPQFLISEVAVDDDVRQGRLAFPMTDLPERLISRRDWAADSAEQNLRSAAFILGSLMARQAIRSPNLRRDFERRFNVKPNWGEVASKDRTFSKVLRDWLGVLSRNKDDGPENMSRPPGPERAATDAAVENVAASRPDGPGARP